MSIVGLALPFHFHKIRHARWDVYLAYLSRFVLENRLVCALAVFGRFVMQYSRIVAWNNKSATLSRRRILSAFEYLFPAFDHLGHKCRRACSAHDSKNQGPPWFQTLRVILTVTRTNVTILTRLVIRSAQNGNVETCFSADDNRACKRDAPEASAGCQEFRLDLLFHP